MNLPHFSHSFCFGVPVGEWANHSITVFFEPCNGLAFIKAGYDEIMGHYICFGPFILEWD